MKTLILFTFCLFISLTFAAIELPPQTKCAAGDPPCDGVDNPCLNGGKCCMQNSKPVCDCSSSIAYGGDFCHLCIKASCGFIDQCATNICQNGGTCTTMPLTRPYYKCTCPTRPDGIQPYYGQLCQAKHICAHNTSVCLNGGTCTATPSRCICPKNAEGIPMYGGTFCQKKNPCAEDPCHAGTKCIFRETVGDHYCACGHDRWGRNCEEISACGDNTHECLNGGICQVRPFYDSVYKRYTCRCINGYACNRCQFKAACPNDLDTGEQRCVHGSCRQSCLKPNDGVCRCLPGWGGVDCSELLFANCNCWTDPNCRNFDGIHFGYHGTCDHIMAKTCVPASQWPSNVPVFQVTASHRNCITGGIEMGIACVHKIGIEIDGDHIELQVNRPARSIDVIVNGQAPDVLPYLKASKNADMNLIEIQVDQHAPLAQLNIETAWGLTIAARGNSIQMMVGLDLTKAIAGKLCGTCGPLNFAGRSFAGSTTPNKKFIETTLKFPITPPGCDPYENGLQIGNGDRKKRAIDEPVFVLKNASVICKSPEQLKIAQEKCSIINDPEGPFAPECYEKNKQRAQLYEACIMDMCVNETFYCSNIEAYAEVCGKLGSYKDWREVTGCGHFCLKNQEFKLGIMKLCSPSCKNKAPCSYDDPKVKVKKVFEEGCVCKDGFIWDSISASCITEDQCGKTEPSFPKGFGQDEMCEFRGLKFLMGEARWDRCRKLCTCGTGGNWTCENYRGYHCGPRECRDINACLHRNVDFPKECDEKFLNHKLVFSEEYAEKFAHRVKRHAIPDEIIGGSLDILNKVLNRDLFNSRVTNHGGNNNAHKHQEVESNDDDDEDGKDIEDDEVIEDDEDIEDEENDEDVEDDENDEDVEDDENDEDVEDDEDIEDDENDEDVEDDEDIENDENDEDNDDDSSKTKSVSKSRNSHKGKGKTRSSHGSRREKGQHKGRRSKSKKGRNQKEESEDSSESDENEGNSHDSSPDEPNKENNKNIESSKISQNDLQSEIDSGTATREPDDQADSSEEAISKNIISDRQKTRLSDAEDRRKVKKCQRH